MDGSSVGEAGVPGVSVTAVMAASVARAVVTASVVAGASVMETSAVASGGSVGVDAEGSVAVPPVQADKASAIHAVTMKSFWTILASLATMLNPIINCLKFPSLRARRAKQSQDR